MLVAMGDEEALELAGFELLAERCDPVLGKTGRRHLIEALIHGFAL